MDGDKEIVKDVEESLHNDIEPSDTDVHLSHSGGECPELCENVKLVYTELVDKGPDGIIDSTVSSKCAVVGDIADANMDDEANLHSNSNLNSIMKINAAIIGVESECITHGVSGNTSTTDDACMDAYAYGDADLTSDVDAGMNADVDDDARMDSDADAAGDTTPIVDVDRGVTHDADVDVNVDVNVDGDMTSFVDADRGMTHAVDADVDAHMNDNKNVDADLIPDVVADAVMTADVDLDADMTLDVNMNNKPNANTNTKPDSSLETDANSNIGGDENIDVDASNNQNSNNVAEFTSNVGHGNCAKNENNADLWTQPESECFHNETIKENKGDGLKTEVLPNMDTMSEPDFDAQNIKGLKQTFHWDICEDGGTFSGSEDDQAEFMKELESFFKERGLEFKPPKFYGEGINCLKLWRAVAKLGGYDQVTSCKLWRQVGESFKPPKTCTTVSWTFRIFYEKALLEYEKYRMHGGELPLPGTPFEEPSQSVQNQATAGNTASGRVIRDSAARAMQGWHSQRLLGNGEDKNSSSTSKREKQMKGFLKRKKSSIVDRADKVSRVKVAKPQLDSAAIDIGPPADWVKVNVQRTKDCFEVYALVPGLLREEVRVQSDPAGRLVITGHPEQADNPWGVTPFKKVVSLPSRIDPHQTSAVVTLHGQLFVRVPFESPPNV